MESVYELFIGVMNDDCFERKKYIGKFTTMVDAEAAFDKCKSDECPHAIVGQLDTEVNTGDCCSTCGTCGPNIVVYLLK